MNKILQYNIYSACQFALLAVLLLTIPALGYAYTGKRGIELQAKTLRFKDNSQLSVSLSNVDANSIVVTGDRIASFNVPEGLCSGKRSADGSMYLTIQTDMPFSMFLNTESGHKVSLYITPKSIIGKTIVLKPLSGVNKKARVWEQDTFYQKVLEKLMRGMILNKAPDGYAYTKIKKAEAQNFFNVAILTPIKTFSGNYLRGTVYCIQNTSHKNITLKPSYFYNRKVRAIALSREHLKPLSTAFVYEISSRGDQ